LHLLHVAPILPELLEFGRSEKPQVEDNREAELAKSRLDFLEDLAQAVFVHALEDPADCTIQRKAHDRVWAPDVGALADDGASGHGYFLLLPASRAIDAGDRAPVFPRTRSATHGSMWATSGPWNAPLQAVCGPAPPDTPADTV
jgi:hypothetical protein